jgi:hypothetical protein
MRSVLEALETTITLIVIGSVLFWSLGAGGVPAILLLIVLLAPLRRTIQWSRTMLLYQRNIRDEIKMLRMELELVRLARPDETPEQDE